MKQRYSIRHIEGPENTRSYYQLIDLIMNDLVGPKFFYESELERSKAYNFAKETMNDVNDKTTT